MAEKDLIKEVVRRFKRMPPGERITKIRKLASRSELAAGFIRKLVPELYREAFPSSSEGGCSESDHPREIYAKPR